jgi:hypothetical protein
MTSHNKLLGMGIVDIPEIGTHLPSNERAPAWRYHGSCTKGKIVLTDSELDKLDADGWVDHPGKLSKLPGLEKFYVEPAEPKKEEEVKTNAEEVQTQTEGEINAAPVDTVEDDVVASPAVGDTLSPVGTSFVIPQKTEPTDDEIKAAALKAESDRVEQMRLKAEERAILGPEMYTCDVEGCGKSFDRERGLRMHKFAAHKIKQGVADAGQDAPH